MHTVYRTGKTWDFLYKSSQVKSSQVKSNTNFNGGRARRLWGARRRERSGGRGAAQVVWLDFRIALSRSRGPGALYPDIHIVFFLIIATQGPVNQLRAFFRKSTVGSAKAANPIQADDAIAARVLCG